MVHPLIRAVDEAFTNCEYYSVDLNGLVETLTRSEDGVFWKLTIVTEGTEHHNIQVSSERHNLQVSSERHNLQVSSDTSEFSLDTFDLDLVTRLIDNGILLC
jgi:hypothetical protein